jgi:hypothetical protein
MPPQTPIVIRTLGDFLAHHGHTLSAHCPGRQHSEPLDVRRLGALRLGGSAMSVCLWCGQSFEPRLSGGKPQRFCGAPCRRAFDHACGAWVRAAIAVGLLRSTTIREWAQDNARVASDGQVGSEATQVAPPETRTQRRKGGEET